MSIPDVDWWMVVRFVIAAEVALLLLLSLPHKDFVCRKGDCSQRHTRWHEHIRRMQ